jgi:hypothetical protein
MDLEHTEGTMLTIPALLPLAMVWLAGVVVPQAKTAPMRLTGGGDVSVREVGDSLHISIKGPRAGLASLCVGDDSRVRILHASAAVAEATYEKQGERWVLKSGFDWKLRDSPRSGGPTEADVRQFLASTGWVANASNAGAPGREFTLRLTDRIRFVGVTFLATAEPMAISHWPASMDDDCRAMKVAQGFLPEAAQFRPSGWHRVK